MSHPPVNLELLTWAMEQDGIHPFWIELVRGQGPRGQALARRLWAMMPKRYRGSW